MNDLVAELRLLGTLAPAPAQAELTRAETILGAPLPAQLVELYRITDGLLGVLSTSLLYKLFEPGKKTGLVETNLFLRSEPYFDAFTRHCVFFGHDGGGAMWGFDLRRPGRVIRWDPEWDGGYEDAGMDVLEVWSEHKERMGEVLERVRRENTH